MATTIIYLLIPLMTPIAFFLAAQITYDYGVLGLLGYSIFWALSFIFLYITRFRTSSTILDTRISKAVKMIYTTEIILYVFIVIKIILTETDFFFTTFINLTLMITVPILVFYLYKINDKLVSVVTILSGITISFLIPTIVYLKVSIPTVYSGINFLSTELLMFDNPATWMLIFSIGIILFVRQLLYRMTNLNDSHLKEGNYFRPYFIAGIISGIVMLSFGAISFLGRAQAVLPDLSDRVSVLIINRFGGQYAQILFITIIFFMTSFIFIRLWVSIRKNSKKENPFSIIPYLIIPSVIVFCNDFTLLDVFLFFGLLWAPLLGLFSIPVSSVTQTRISLVLGIITSMIIAYLFTIPAGIIAGSLISMLSVMVVRLFSIIKNRSTSV